LAWTADTPAGTSLTMRIHTGNTPTPDATWTPFTGVGANGGAIGTTARYVQYKADLRATDPSQTPVVYDVTFGFPGLATVNHAPVANVQSVTTAEDTDVTIALRGSGADVDALTHAMATVPAHGTLTDTAPNVTYTPALNYSGPDSFTFTVKDATLVSTAATVSITVTPVNDPPVANAQSVTTAEDTATAITLTGSDVDGDALTYAVATQPAHGTLTGTAPNMTYTPAANYNGPDSFTFKANDGTVDSSAATVSITITAVNDAPVANDQAVTTNEDTAKAIVLTASDVDGDPLTYAIVAAPTHGALSGSAPTVTYTPAANYNGPDSFTFTAKDATLDSAAAALKSIVTR